MKAQAFPYPLWQLPRIRLAGWFPAAPVRQPVTHALTEYHALHLYDYTGRVWIDDVEYAFNPGDLTVCPRQHIIHFAVAAPGRHLCVHFLTELAAEVPAAPVPAFTALGPWQDRLRERLTSVITARAQADVSATAAAAAGAAFQEVLLWLALHAATPEAPGPGHRVSTAVEAAARHIEENLALPLSIPAVCRQVGVSQNYLARRFRQRYGMTMPRYILRRRVEVAEHLLSTTALPVREVARLCGMPDPHHFNKQFRHLTGVSPSAWRRTQRRVETVFPQAMAPPPTTLSSSS